MSVMPGADTPVPKAFRQGTHRAISPEATLARLSPHLSEMGITRVANVTGLDIIGIPVTMVSRPNSRSLSVSQGKGLTLDAARASGLMEAIEGYHGEHIMLPLKLASYEEIRCSHRVIDVWQLPRSSTGTFHPNLPLLWIEGFDLLQQEPVWLPYATVHCNYCMPMPPSTSCFPVTTDGLAGGNHLLEALSHAICEVVERDAATLWKLRRMEERLATRLDLSTVDDPACCVVLEKCERAGVIVAAWDITSDVGLPAFEAWIAERVIDPLRPLYQAAGMGCHPVRTIALLRALTEAAQSRLTMISGARDDMFPEEYEQQRHQDTLAAQRSLMELPGPGRRFAEIPTFEFQTFDQDVELQLNVLRKVGIERVVAINLTRDDWRIPVVRVVIPGMESVAADIPPDYVFGARAQALLESHSGVFLGLTEADASRRPVNFNPWQKGQQI
ncbi:MAG TPA: YcaO-like family protein [Ktedonobacteraceae bacterium]